MNKIIVPNPTDGFPDLTTKSWLTVNKHLHIAFPHKKPNIWWRTWQYLLLGWKWTDEKYKD